MPEEQSRRSERRAWRLATPLALVACGVLLITSGETSGNAFRGTGISDMADLVSAEAERTEELAAEVSELNAEIDELTDRTVENPVDEEEFEQLQYAAGHAPVVGAGLTVTLDDAEIPEEDTEGIDPDNYLVHQQDVDAVINALWAGGAEAMMIEDQRIISTSGVQCVGSVLYLKGRHYTTPFTIAAIGDAESMLAALDASDAVARYREYVDLIGLGYATEVREEIRMPGYDGPRDISAETAT